MSNSTTIEWAFNSLVCFDLETTGLPQYEIVRVTELSLVGVVRKHIICSGNTETAFRLPRVLHKLCFTVYPRKIISLGASNTTGLWNELLEPIQPWSKSTADMLITFCNQLPPPVCLVAHNGNKFDFPILKSHLDLVNCSLPSDMICVDSLDAFRAILVEPEATIKTVKEIDEGGGSLNQLKRVAEKVEESLRVNSLTERSEVTPKSKPAVNALLPCRKKTRYETNVCLSQFNRSQVKRCLYPVKPYVSYKLCDIHNRLFGEFPKEVHNAEGDAISLLKCIVKTAPAFLLWANENHKVFSSIQ